MKPEDFRASTQRPFTGEEYLKSLILNCSRIMKKFLCFL